MEVYQNSYIFNLTITNGTIAIPQTVWLTFRARTYITCLKYNHENNKRSYYSIEYSGDVTDTLCQFFIIFHIAKLFYIWAIFICMDYKARIKREQII